MEIPVYLFTGFLESGKTKFIQDTLAEQDLADGVNTLLLMCEEGIEEYDPAAFNSPNVFCETIENEDELTTETLSKLRQKHNASFVIVEYNGMWQLQKLYEALPEGWFVYQELMLCDATTIENYNKNMRSLVVDKLTSCDLCAFNRVDRNTDRMALHKLVRGVSRSADIVYDMVDGTIEYDEIEDPLPFDINADVVTIEDKDYAYWYRDIAEDTDKYDGKTVHFKGVVLKDKTVPKGSFFLGRHLMTCCADDIKYSPLVCDWSNSETLKSYDWVEITGKITVKKHKGYQSSGPVVTVLSLAPAEKADPEVASFN